MAEEEDNELRRLAVGKAKHHPPSSNKVLPNNSAHEREDNRHSTNLALAISNTDPTNLATSTSSTDPGRRDRGHKAGRTTL